MHSRKVLARFPKYGNIYLYFNMIEHQHEYMQDGRATDNTANHACHFSLQDKQLHEIKTDWILCLAFGK